jgi:acid phosphatase
MNRQGRKKSVAAHRAAHLTESLESRTLLAGVPTPAHVVVVMEENYAYNEIIGSSSAPYINTLAQQGALFTQSFAVSHPSQPNYLAIFSGSTQGVTDDNGPVSFPGPDLGSALANAGKSFAGYSEDLPSAGSTVLTSGGYARKHNPWSDFTDVPSSANQPFSNFPTNYDSLPTVSFVVPNLNDDMHDGTIQQGDSWLQSNIGAYATWAKTHNSLLIVTFDEDDGSSSNHIATIFYGQPVVTGNYSENINHYRVLRTILDMYGATPMNNAASTTAITDVWQTTLAQSNVITGTSAVDSITLKQDADHQHIDWTLGTTTSQMAINDPSGLTINGNGGNDKITLNYANGNPLPNTVHFNGTFTLTGLSGTNPLAGTKLEIGQSTLYFNYAGTTTPASYIKSALTTGYNAGAWNGAASATTGSITTAATTGTTFGIGYADSSDAVVAGQPANTVEVRYTVMGDANLDRIVNSADATILGRNYMVAGKTAWDQGNFNYDSAVNMTDASLLQRNFNVVATGSVTPATSNPGSTPTAGTAPTTPVTNSGDPTTTTITPTDNSTSPTSDGDRLFDSAYRRRRRIHINTH